MLKKHTLIRVSMLAFLLLISSFFMPQANTEASFNNCGIYSIEEYSSYSLDDGEITIQCGGVRTVWEGILQGAVKTNQTSSVNNYENVAELIKHFTIFKGCRGMLKKELKEDY